MIEYIKRIQNKPESHRRTFAIAVSFSLVCLIFIVWISVKFSTFSDDFIATKNTAQDNIITPVTSFSKMMANSFEGVKESIKTYTNTQ